MCIRAPISPGNPETFPNWAFRHLEIEYDAPTQSVWMNYKSDAPHFYTLPMLMEAIEFAQSLRLLFESDCYERYPIRYFVMASKKTTVFSLGGDLATFSAAIRKRARDDLRRYAYACIDVMYGLTTGFDLPIVTLSAVRGQCLGGGFEGALATHFLIAEEGSKLGVPEIGFNTFPGMGAVSFLNRRVAAVRAEQIITNGAVHSARELHALDLVDVVAPDGDLRETTLDWMRDGGDEHWRRRWVLTQHRKRCFPLPREELVKIVEQWVDCSFSISEHDLRYMERLVAAQQRLASNRSAHGEHPAAAASAQKEHNPGRREQ
jgi:DSF synthase